MRDWYSLMGDRYMKNVQCMADGHCLKNGRYLAGGMENAQCMADDYHLVGGRYMKDGYSDGRCMGNAGCMTDGYRMNRYMRPDLCRCLPSYHHYSNSSRCTTALSSILLKQPESASIAEQGGYSDELEQLPLKSASSVAGVSVVCLHPT